MGPPKISDAAERRTTGTRRHERGDRKLGSILIRGRWLRTGTTGLCGRPPAYGLRRRFPQRTKRQGVPVDRILPSETADGRILPVDVGEANIRLEGLQFHTPVIFAEDNEPSLLGVVSLEQAALAVDPLTGKLIPTNLLRL